MKTVDTLQGLQGQEDLQERTDCRHSARRKYTDLNIEKYRVELFTDLCTLGCFKCDTLSKKNCNASTIPSRAYINHIQKNFFLRTSLEGQTTWSKMVKIDLNHI